MPDASALPTPAFFRDLPLPGLSAGPGGTLAFRIGLSPTGPGVRKGHWILLVLFAPLLVPLFLLLGALLLAVALVTLLAAPLVPAARRAIRTRHFAWRHPATIELDRHPLVPGETAEVHVHQPGLERLEQFTVALVCREQARWRVGTDTRTEDRVVMETIIAERPLDARGETLQAAFTLPEDAMHSFAAENNLVEWRVEARRAVPGGNVHADAKVFQVLPLGVVERVLDERLDGGLA